MKIDVLFLSQNLLLIATPEENPRFARMTVYETKIFSKRRKLLNESILLLITRWNNFWLYIHFTELSIRSHCKTIPTFYDHGKLII
jgi:hypothetical protein